MRHAPMKVSVFRSDTKLSMPPAYGLVSWCWFSETEALDLVEHVRLASSLGQETPAGTPFGLERGKEAYHRCVVQTLPNRLNEQVMPWSAIRRLNCSDVNWAALVGAMQQTDGLASAPHRPEEGVG